jgi:hypothetical protein
MIVAGRSAVGSVWSKDDLVLSLRNCSASDSD